MLCLHSSDPHMLVWMSVVWLGAGRSSHQLPALLTWIADRAVRMFSSLSAVTCSWQRATLTCNRYERHYGRCLALIGAATALCLMG